MYHSILNFFGTIRHIATNFVKFLHDKLLFTFDNLQLLLETDNASLFLFLLLGILDLSISVLTVVTGLGPELQFIRNCIALTKVRLASRIVFIGPFLGRLVCSIEKRLGD